MCAAVPVQSDWWLVVDTFLAMEDLNALLAIVKMKVNVVVVSLSPVGFHLQNKAIL